MKKQLFIWILLCLPTLYAQELAYHVSPNKIGGKPALDILCEFEGNHEGVTEVIIPPSKDRLEILHMRCLAPDSLIEDTDHPEVKRVIHSPGGKFQLHYTVVAQDNSPLPSQDRPIIQNDYFLFFGYNLFVHPDEGDQQEAHIRLQWDGFPKEWQIANSYGIDLCIQELDQPIWLFLNGIYGGGKSHITQCGDHSSPIFVGIYGEFSFSRERLVRTIDTIISSQREFWEDSSFPYTFVSIHPNGDPQSIAGQGTPNGFAIFTKDFLNESEKEWKNLAFVLSHECFHTWNGLKMRPIPADQSMAWFVEGFTDYYATTFLLRTALIEWEDYLGLTNGTLDNYFTSPVRNERNERITQDFWNDYTLQKLPYYRGFLLAWRWDCALKKRGDTLDTAMRALFHRTQQEKRPYSLEDIIELSNLPSARDDIERYILSGQTLNPDPEAFGHDCYLDLLPTPHYVPFPASTY